MRQLDFGKVIGALREKHGWSQLEIAVRLRTSPAVISRIERGERTPTSTFVESALQLLGEDSQEYISFFLDGNEKYGCQTVQKLRNLHIQGDFAEMRRLIEEAEGRKPFASGLNLQFLLFCKAVSNRELSSEERLDRLIQAITLTIKDFAAETVGSTVLTYHEIIIIGEIASVHHHMGDNEKAIQIMYGLKESMNRNYMDEWEKSRTYPMVLYNLSVYLGALDRDDEMYDACVEAQKYAIRYNNMRVLPKVAATIAHYKFLKGDKIGMIDPLYQAYFSARMMQQYPLADTIAKVAKDRYKIDLEAAFILFLRPPQNTDCQTE